MTGTVATIEDGIAAEPPRVNEPEHAVELAFTILERLSAAPTLRHLLKLHEQRNCSRRDMWQPTPVDRCALGAAHS
jgi:hypothetical protein